MIRKQGHFIKINYCPQCHSGFTPAASEPTQCKSPLVLTEGTLNIVAIQQDQPQNTFLPSQVLRCWQNKIEPFHLQSTSITFPLVRFNVSFSTSLPQEAPQVGIAHVDRDETKRWWGTAGFKNTLLKLQGLRHTRSSIKCHNNHEVWGLAFSFVASVIIKIFS